MSMKTSKELLKLFAKNFGWSFRIDDCLTYVQVCIRNKNGEALDICDAVLNKRSYNTLPDMKTEWRATGDTVEEACDNYLEMLIGRILLMYKNDAHLWPAEYCAVFAESREEFELKLAIYTGE